MTRINLINHNGGWRDTIELSTPRHIIIERLRQIIGRPTFDSWDDYSHAYARLDGEAIILHFFGFSEEAVAGLWNQILGTLQRRVTA